jgi:UDP-N-acetyl-D-galactosamine dehydrogenase
MDSNLESDNLRLGVIGLGYVGLPLAVEFGRQLPTLGFDINTQRIAELRSGVDHTLEVEPQELQRATHLTYSAELEDLARCNVFIVTVPTPIDEYKRPDLRPLESASRTVGRAIGKGGVAIYESTVYPGATEEVCVPIIERESGLRFNRTSSPATARSASIPATSSIAWKHHEGDLRLHARGRRFRRRAVPQHHHRRHAQGFQHPRGRSRQGHREHPARRQHRPDQRAGADLQPLGIDTEEVLEAAGTKWNFLPFRPGLVGGHCIGVDPYYLTHKAQQIGYHPEVILAGRRINDGMGAHVASAWSS